MNVLIVGGGKVGAHLVTLLLANGHRVRLVELCPATCEALRRRLPAELVLLGSGTAPHMLEAAGVRQADVVAAVSGADETNLVVANLARFEYRVPRVIARINDPQNAWMFSADMGVDVALNQADLMAHLIEEELTLGEMTTLLKLRHGQYALVEEKIHPSASAVGQTLGNLELPAACVLVAILRQGQLLLPGPDVVLQVADEVLAVVHAAQAEAFAALLSARVAAPPPVQVEANL
jgi:trk system potassium uptake protein